MKAFLVQNSPHHSFPYPSPKYDITLKTERNKHHPPSLINIWLYRVKKQNWNWRDSCVSQTTSESAHIPQLGSLPYAVLPLQRGDAQSALCLWAIQKSKRFLTHPHWAAKDVRMQNIPGKTVLFWSGWLFFLNLGLHRPRARCKISYYQSI